MKVDRHSKIVELIGKYQIETQEELAEYLKKAGYHVTQATVSRDIRELKLTKAPGKNGRQCYAVMQHQKDFGEIYPKKSISAGNVQICADNAVPNAKANFRGICGIRAKLRDK